MNVWNDKTIDISGKEIKIIVFTDTSVIYLYASQLSVCKSQVRSGFGNIFTWYISLHLLQTKHLLSLVHFHQHCTPFCNMAKPTSIRLARISVWNLKASFSISISPWEKVLQKIYILLSSSYFSRSKFSSLRVCGMYARNFFWTKFFEFSPFYWIKNRANGFRWSLKIEHKLFIMPSWFITLYIINMYALPLTCFQKWFIS